MPLALAIALVLPASFAAAEGKDGCKCVANGVRYDQGSLVCLHLPSGEKLARCGMRLNNSSWEIVRDGCQQTSSLTPLDTAGRSSPLPKSAMTGDGG